MKVAAFSIEVDNFCANSALTTAINTNDNVNMVAKFKETNFCTEDGVDGCNTLEA